MDGFAPQSEFALDMDVPIQGMSRGLSRGDPEGALQNRKRAVIC